MSGLRRFRTSFTFMEGNVEAIVLQGKIVGVNLANWTVDVISQFDRKRYFDIQVGSTYLHYNNGEGIYMFPEVGAKCMVTIPSDSSPPYVSSFIMPVEYVDQATDDAPNGTTSNNLPNRNTSGASFSGGRPRAAPGSLYMRTRDGNFLILHRGGILQFGCSEVCQSIYVPITNTLIEMTENYAQHTQGGSVLWGIQEGPAYQDYPSEYTHTFRLLADRAEADLRIKVGTVHDPIPEPAGDAGEQSLLDQLGIGKEQVVVEMVIAPKGFNADSGDAIDKDTRDKATMRFFFDKAGGTFLRSESSLLVRAKKKLYLKSGDSMTLESLTDITLKAKNGIVMDGGASAHIKGDVVRLGKGSTPIATQGALVQLTFPYTPLPTPGGPPLVLFGMVLTGDPALLGLEMAYDGIILAGTLGEINVAAKASLVLLNPLLAQVDFALFGTIGLGALQANFQAQLQAALKAELDIGLNISNPLLGFQLALAGVVALEAQINAALAGAIPAVSLDATGQLTALASLSAVLALQIGGLEALIQGALAVKIPAVSFAGLLAGQLSAGPIFLLAFEDMALADAAAALSGDMTVGLVNGANHIGPTDHCYGILIVTKSPSAWGAIKATLTPL